VRSRADALWDELLRHCRLVNHRFLVIDAPRGLHGDVLLRWASRFRAQDPASRAFGAVYAPWLMAGDRVVPPSGAMMGLMARLELERAPVGVCQPPANVPLQGVTHAEVDLDWGEVAQLAEGHVNPLVSQAGRGVVAWGARTLSSDPAWQFINSRRVVGLVTEQLRRDNEWAVFETNDASLWKVLERDVSVRLREFFEAGMIAGTRALPEFSVRCDSETNPLELRDAGGLNIAVSLRPVGTTESILVDLRFGG
jgi:phage tail sheath protein FI